MGAMIGSQLMENMVDTNVKIRKIARKIILITKMVTKFMTSYAKEESAIHVRQTQTVILPMAPNVPPGPTVVTLRKSVFYLVTVVRISLMLMIRKLIPLLVVGEEEQK